eukprot:223768-Pyramimonas_sp.AAC.1
MKRNPLAVSREFYPRELPSHVWSGVDRDPRRRVGIPTSAYLLRSGRCFLEDISHCECMPNLTPLQVVRMQRGRDSEMVP